MQSFISLHKENWRSHSYAAARCVGDQVLFQMLKANSNIDTVLSLHGQRCRRSGGEQKDIRQTL